MSLGFWNDHSAAILKRLSIALRVVAFFGSIMSTSSQRYPYSTQALYRKKSLNYRDSRGAATDITAYMTMPRLQKTNTLDERHNQINVSNGHKTILSNVPISFSFDTGFADWNPFLSGPPLFPSVTLSVEIEAARNFRRFSAIFALRKSWQLRTILRPVRGDMRSRDDSYSETKRHFWSQSWPVSCTD